MAGEAGRGHQPSEACEAVVRIGAEVIGGIAVGELTALSELFTECAQEGPLATPLCEAGVKVVMDSPAPQNSQDDARVNLEHLL
jgi:hypothetical protein